MRSIVTASVTQKYLCEIVVSESVKPRKALAFRPAFCVPHFARLNCSPFLTK